MSDCIANMILYLCRLITGIEGEVKEPLPEGPTVYYANHSSHLDAMVVLSLLPKQLRARVWSVGSRRYWQAGILRRYFSNKIFKTVMIDRAGESEITGAFSAIADMSRVLKQGDSIIIFPEGTRNSEGHIGEFKGGIYMLAREVENVVFVPVYLENLNRIMPKGEYILIPLLGRAVFGPSFRLEKQESKKKFLARAREELVRLRY